ncbi:LuxR C-terminal-related transcriptional regulator [Oceanobacter mangrovi]|uniref:LuxR C-terminal-related transcriptional regulator n=1 Tax=Oceanobacter mangrovi TaxID=2862510 RepID=UPI001C8E08D9|nr:LuxR C-terminal-related transcriptional regulator [Oceanobacter mangrovi]
MTDVILATKLFAPAARPGQVARPALLQRLASGLHGHLTLISAPAGFGKSTLLAEFARGSGCQVGWLSLETADSSPKRFFHYLIAALQRLETDFGQSLLAALLSPEQALDERWLTRLLNELTQLASPTMLVLDDYHCLDNRELEQWLGWLIERLPGQCHLAIASREDPGLPLSRWRMRGLLNELRQPDLRFDEQETSQFFHSTMALNLSPQAISTLADCTEGWIAGLQLAGLSLQGHADAESFVQQFSGTNRFVLDYLLEEVLQQLTPEQRHFLLTTSVLERLEASLCDAVTAAADGDSLAMLQWLESNNLFLIPLDSQRRWYRYHHLFAEVLRNQAQLSEAGLQQLHRRASGWYEQQQMFSEAIDHAILADDALAVELLERYWPGLRFYSIENLFVDWMAQLPAVSWQKCPVVSVYYGLTLLSWDVERGCQILADTRTLMEQAPDGSGLLVRNRNAFASVAGILAIGDAYMAGSRRDMPAVLQACQQALQLLPATDYVWRGAAAAMQGMVQWAAGELARAAAGLRLSVGDMLRSGDLSARLAASYVLSDILIQQGDLQQAEQENEQALAALQQHDQPLLQACADTWVIKAELALERSGLVAAEEHLQAAEALGLAARLPQSARHAPLVRSRIALARGDFDAAGRWLDEADALHVDCPTPDVRPLHCWRARLWIESGQLHRVQQWADAQALGLQLQPAYFREFEFLTLVRQQLALQQPVTAVLLEWLALAQQQQRLASQLDLQLLLALGWLQQGDEQQAATCWQQAQRLSQQTGLQQPLQQRLFEPLQQRFGSSQNISSRPSAVQVIAVEQPESLSNRELDVLRLLDSELSGPQIADQLFISLNTFRSHNKNIYAKLAVNSRQGAIRKAKSLGLLVE